MKLIKKLQTILTKNIRILISIMILSYLTFYMDIFDLFNKKDVIDFKTVLLEEKQDLEENLTSESDANNNLYKYLIVGSCLALFALIIYYNSGGSIPSVDIIMSDIDFNEIAEINELKGSDISRALFIDNAPKAEFVDELCKQL